MTTNHAEPDPSDVPGVAFPPPVLFAGTLALGLLLGRATAASERGARARQALGAGSLVAGLGLLASGVGTFRQLGTNVIPYKPTTALATDGVFALTRNPIYVGFTFIYTGVALLSRSLPAFALLPVVLALLDRGVVDPEERYLERKFGDAYRAYRNRVPRWF